MIFSKVEICLLVLFVTCLFKVNTIETIDTEERIIGGEYTSIQRYPFHAVIQFNFFEMFRKLWTTVCGGVIIHKKFVLTMSECTRINEQKIRVLAGTGEIGRVWNDEEFIHPVIAVIHYKLERIHYKQVSVLSLESELKFSDTLKSIKIYNSDLLTSFDQLFTQGEIVGYGRTTDTNALWSKFTYSIKRADVKIVNNHHCNLNDDPWLICIKELTGRPCHGNVGDPLLVDVQGTTELAGLITPYYEACPKEPYAVCVRTGGHVHWIESLISAFHNETYQ